MNLVLGEVLGQLNLQPGQIQRVAANGRRFEIRRLPDDELDFGEGIMLQPWVDFPRGKAARTAIVRFGKLSLPDPPVIPPSDEEVA